MIKIKIFSHETRAELIFFIDILLILNINFKNNSKTMLNNQYLYCMYMPYSLSVLHQLACCVAYIFESM